MTHHASGTYFCNAAGCDALPEGWLISLHDAPLCKVLSVYFLCGIPINKILSSENQNIWILPLGGAGV